MGEGRRVRAGGSTSGCGPVGFQSDESVEYRARREFGGLMCWGLGIVLDSP